MEAGGKRSDKMHLSLAKESIYIELLIIFYPGLSDLSLDM